MKLDDITCRDCGETAKTFRKKEFSVGEEKRSHLGAYCANCGRWLKWLSKDEKACRRL